MDTLEWRLVPMSDIASTEHTTTDLQHVYG